MNILMVLSSNVFPPDGRVERELRSLMDAGHNLFLMARRAPGQKTLEDVNGVHVIRVPLPFQGKKAVSDFIFFFIQRYLIFFSILRACKRYRINALHVHDLPYAFAATLAGKVLGIGVVFDMHEHFTCMLNTSFEAPAYSRFRPFAFILLGMLSLDERIACRLSNKVIVVADEHIDRIAGLGVAREDIVVVTNTEDIDNFSGLETDHSVIEKYQNDFVILYIGAFCLLRGLDTAIKAMPEILKAIPNARLLLVGDGYNRCELEKLTAEMGLDDRVTFAGYQPFAKLPTYIKLCDVGLIPHISTPHVETTMPNKIFQFMMLGKAVVVSSVKPMTRVVEDAKCGRVFKVSDETSLAETIIEMKDGNLRKQLGQNGKSAVKEKYNWQITVQKLLNIYEKN